MVLNRQSFNTLNIGYSAAFQKGFDEVPTQYEQIATVVPSSTKEQSYAWIGQLPSMREWIGEREIQNMAASDYVIKNKSYERTLGVDRDDIEDDNFGVYTPIFTDMGQCAKRHPNKLVFEALRNGFQSKCYDGHPFFSKQHMSGDETYSNLGHKKLSPEAYQEARTSIMSLRDEHGQSLGLVPDTLVVAPGNEAAGRLILKADLIDGTTNIYKDTAQIMVEPELATRPDAWYLLCTTRSLKPIIYQKRKECTFTNLTQDTDQNVFMEKKFFYGCDSRGNVGYGFPQMAYGSDGTIAG